MDSSVQEIGQEASLLKFGFPSLPVVRKQESESLRIISKVVYKSTKSKLEFQRENADFV